MTFQDHAIAVETTVNDDGLLGSWGDRTPQSALPLDRRHDATHTNSRRRLALVLALEDGRAMSDALHRICEFLQIFVERIDSHDDILPFLQRCQPMAVVAAMDAEGQDGCNVLMTVARHDPSLPVLLMTGSDPDVAGAVDAVTELWGLTEVLQVDSWPAPGALAEFLCRAGMQGNCLALLPV
jgi:hypothetical protein